MTVDGWLDEHVLPYVLASAPHSRRGSAIEGSYARGCGLLIGPADEAFADPELLPGSSPSCRSCAAPEASCSI
jgi:hypothetical protein